MRALLVLLCLACSASAEVIDRLAITLGREVITELQLDEELRVTAFLNSQPVVRDRQTRRAAGDRLVEQLLIRRDMEINRFPEPDAADVDKYVEEVRSKYENATAFASALERYELTEETLRAHLELQLTTLRFIEYRFAPEVDISDADILSAYQRQVAGWKASHSGPAPTLAVSRASIQKELTEQRIDSALSVWLEARRRRVHVVYLDPSLG